MQEIVLICVIALIVVGPKRLPEIARALGKGYGEFRRAFDEMKRNVDTEFNTDEIRRSFLDLPPPPSPLTPVAPYPPPETLLADQPGAGPSGDAHPSPPEVMDASPPAPEKQDPAPTASRSDSQSHA